MPPPSRRRVLSDADRAEWAAFARHIRLLPGRALPALPEPAPLQHRPLPPVAAAGPVRARPPGPIGVGEQPGGLDRGSWNRLARGKLNPERTLDLHGHSVQAAFHALQAFLHAARADRLRCVEIVTGRGSGEGTGAIRRELPIWLNLPSLRPLILAATHPHAANPGAVRLLLRRPR